MKRPTGAIATRQELQELVDRSKHEEVILYAAGIDFPKPAKFIMCPRYNSIITTDVMGPRIENVLQLTPVKGWVSLQFDNFNIFDRNYVPTDRYLFTNYWFALRYSLIINARHEARLPF